MTTGSAITDNQKVGVFLGLLFLLMIIWFTCGPRGPSIPSNPGSPLTPYRSSIDKINILYIIIMLTKTTTSVDDFFKFKGKQNAEKTSALENISWIKNENN